MTPHFFPNNRNKAVSHDTKVEKNAKRLIWFDLIHYFEIDMKFMGFKANFGVQNSAEVV